MMPSLASSSHISPAVRPGNGVCSDLEARDPRGALVESGERIVGRGGESLRVEMACEDPIAAVEIENRDGFAPREMCQRARSRCSTAGGRVVGIDVDVAGIVDVREE